MIAQDIEQYLTVHQHKSLLRFITCGSVDDGKSTLIGRLLYESKMIFDDQLAAISVPVIGRSNVIGAINIVWLKRFDTTAALQGRHLQELRTAAERIGQRWQDATPASAQIP